MKSGSQEQNMLFRSMADNRVLISILVAIGNNFNRNNNVNVESNCMESKCNAEW